ncbi:MAG TPA: hypothetical protein VGQ78_11030 [Vicinamibacteria bacterium]|nr:hypothetical protein [Vicinamibacteria bacterium]
MRRLGLAAAIALAWCPPLAAEAPTAFGGRLTFGGDASFGIAAKDAGFFNYTDYDLNGLRLSRLSLSASLRAFDRVWLLSEVRSENMDQPRAYALYVRFRPWRAHRLDVQAGLIPPAFGAFPRRNYATENLLIGAPLAYQYLTALRADAAPATPADLFRMRGRGWLASYPIGNTEPDRGLPLVSALRWDTGVQARAASDTAEVIASVTTGTLSNPRMVTDDDNSGRQLSGRVVLRPVTGLVAGVSASRGAYLSRTVTRLLGSGRGRSQTAWGADIEYSRAYWLARAEAVWSEWDLPTLDARVRARGFCAEGRYKLRPGLYAAGRFDHLGFSRLLGTDWDAPVRRLELGGGWQILRYVLLKAVVQDNRRPGGRVRSFRTGAAQLTFWF